MLKKKAEEKTLIAESTFTQIVRQATESTKVQSVRMIVFEFTFILVFVLMQDKKVIFIFLLLLEWEQRTERMIGREEKQTEVLDSCWNTTTGYQRWYQ